MSRMSELAMLLETKDEKSLIEFFGTLGWKDKVAEIGGKEFLKAFNEIEVKKVNQMNDAIKSTTEYNLGKKLLHGEMSNLTTKNIIDDTSDDN